MTNPVDPQQSDSQEQRDRFFALSQDLLGVARFSGALEQVNPAWTQCLGWSLQELTAQPYLRFVHPDDHSVMTTALAVLRRGEVAMNVESRSRCKDGSYRWLSWNNYPLVTSQQIFMVVRDITEQRDNDSRLRLLENCISRMNDMVVISGVDRKDLPWPGIVFVNDAFVRQTGYTRDDVIGKTLEMLEGPKTQQDAVHQIDVAMQRLQPVRVEILNYTKAGAEMWVEIDKVPVADDQGRLSHWVSIERDITERKKIELVQKRSEILLAKTEELAGIGSWDWDLIGSGSFWSDGLYAIYGREKSDGVPSFDAWKETIHPDDLDTLEAFINGALATNRQYAAEFRIHTKDTGELRYIASRGESILDRNGKILRVWGVDQDITARKLTQQALESANTEMAHSNARLENIAHYDALTSLPNRVLLADRLQLAMVQSQRRSQSLAVAFLDLDGFKAVNDTHGHNMGDQLLIALAQRMKEALREGDSLARLGGDEFVAVMADLGDTSDCTPVLERLLRAAADPISIGKVVLQLSASIGVTVYPQDNADADLLMRHADQAMYLAKQAGKNRFHMFDIAQDVAVQSQREHLEHIRQALDSGEFVLHFQPKVNMRTGTVIGAEALIRWQHPQRGLLFPAAFLPLIGEHPISIRMGEWVICTALDQMERWQALGLTMTVSVNIGASHLQQDGFASRLGQLLAEYPTIAPQNLELEVLETSALEDIQRVSQIMRSCQNLGVRFALDDFGTGYSSLTYLKRLPAETLKIDQSFVRDMLIDSDDLAIVRGVIGLAAAFRREVIAEGVETIAHGESLLNLGCHLAQGYGIARPMPGGDMPQWVASWHLDVAWSGPHLGDANLI
ncbi:EAL domain-containing protein [Rhodoferax sp.]|uniref:sensor domain-containing protein n=1 Tax=Rhodoferax sp. TaxID=50421 RepID=UPI00374C949A